MEQRIKEAIIGQEGAIATVASGKQSPIALYSVTLSQDMKALKYSCTQTTNMMECTTANEYIIAVSRQVQ